MNEQQQLITWLNDAHAMEQSLINVLQNHAEDARDFPEVRARAEDHIDETRDHAMRIEKCLSLLGEKPSFVKEPAGRAFGVVKGAASGPVADEMVKNFLSDYTAEHMEIASYRSLIAAAEELGQDEIAQLCSDNLRDDEAMAKWLGDRIPDITRDSLRQLAAAK